MISAALIEYLKKGIFTFLGVIVAVYLFVILLTYTGNDPSWSHISSDMTTINNMGGSTGAWLSDLLYSFFGFGAWWLLVFLVYESILIWWDNKPTFWLLRLVSYVFLLLSSSALFAQLVAIIQQVANPMVTGLQGVAGGIIGLELQARLAQLLSQWGSVLFLTVFVIITATFAFNIHWTALYRKFTALSWLGSGVRDERSQSQYDNSQASQSLSEAETADAQAHANEFEQLPLELPVASHNQTADMSGRFSGVLTDFLAKSGLGASVKASLAADAAAEAAAAQKTLKKSMNDTPHTSAASTTETAPNTSNTARVAAMSEAAATTAAFKVEPSFAWNDDNMVDDLLSNELMAAQASSHSASDPIPADAAQSDTLDMQITPVIETNAVPNVALNDGQQVASAQTIQNPVINEVAKSSAATNVADSSSVDMTSKVDELASTWLAEHEVSSAATDNTLSATQAESNTQAESKPVAEVDEAVRNTAFSDASQADDQQQVLAKQPTGNNEAQAQDVQSAVTPTSAVAESVDMTPTNTPPADPKAAPTVETASPTNSAESATSSKPTISFAVPEDGSGNLITDMMPDDDSKYDDTNTPVMPDIHDDAAFAQRSRAMQTAEYRGSLSAIPELSILDKPDPNREPSYTVSELEQLSELLEIKLQEFNVKAEVVNAIPGPVVTRFEVELAAGVKASKVTGISRDLARSLSMASLRVVEVIPGKPYIGIEVPNKQREMVRLIELLNTEKYKDPKAQISMAMGKDIGGNPIITDLARAPHMLVAGTTGSGKSVLVNSMLLSMLLKYTPNELRLILIDPKQLELANYNDIPHLLTPVVTDMTEAASSLSWCVAEMERRYQLMSLLKVRKLDEFNKKVRAAEKAGKPMLDPLWRPNDNVSIDQAPKLKTLPMIVIVADEFADMIMQVGKQAEELITRLAQKSRAAGIHLMLATQRPSVDVITGLIKANIPVRAALRVNSKVDSRTILDSGGAEDMLGNGDMLFLGPGQIEPDRVHGAYVSDEEVNRVCDAWRERGAPDYIDNMAGNFELSSPGGGSTGSASGEDDDLYNDAVAFIMETRKVSASSIQRKFSIGYNRAARIVDSMEEAGLVSSMGKSGKRELLM
ncbi:DNA translocase FtsK [Psychrobacter fulvigenes]|uniref:DNA translocase FtsK n=1 Tax=Psychrobacter fulvigenes TaxID=533323 RepID=UPI00191AB06A|nr:DNA translocase FtsK [Psychrobacter fulvigenes]